MVLKDKISVIRILYIFDLIGFGFVEFLIIEFANKIFNLHEEIMKKDTKILFTQGVF